jgi:hypothetical protein
VRVVLYTALFGGVDTLKEFDTAGYLFYAFTDRPAVSGTWTCVMEVEAVNARLEAKWFKMHPRKLPTPLEPDDVTIWLDASITLLDTRKFVETCVGAVEDAPIAFFRHPERDNIVDEAAVSACLPKYADQKIDDQVAAYLEEGLPDGHGLWAGSVIVRRFGLTDRIDLAWWHENVTRTIQDQISLPYVLWRLGVTPGTIPGNVYGSPMHSRVWAGPVDIVR